MSKKVKLYNYWGDGKERYIKAYSKKQIKEHFKVSSNVMTDYCSEASSLALFYYKEKISLDLT